MAVAVPAVVVLVDAAVVAVAAIVVAVSVVGALVAPRVLLLLLLRQLPPQRPLLSAPGRRSWPASPAWCPCRRACRGCATRVPSLRRHRAGSRGGGEKRKTY